MDVPLFPLFSQLPVEIQLEVLSLLPTKDILQNVALVSKRFYKFSKDVNVHINVQVHDMVRLYLFFILKEHSQMTS